MTTISLNRLAAKQNNLTIGEALLLLLLDNKVNTNEARDSLISKGFITAERNSSYQQIGWRLTTKGVEAINNTIIDSDKLQHPEDKLLTLATTLKSIFPKGKKPGTNYYWADGAALISRRLKLFFKKYGTTYNEDQIIQAATTYVQGFNGDYQYMRLLKYFIFKEKVGVDGEIEGDSELISYVENAGQEDECSIDWTSTLK